MGVSLAPPEAALRCRILLEALVEEDATMLRVAAAIPEDRMKWKPDAEPCRTAEALAIHAARGGRWFLRMVDGRPPPDEGPSMPADKTELLARIRGEQEHFRARVAAYPAEKLAAACVIAGGVPNIVVLCWHREHMVHHRAQLALYLRLMGARVPSIYGPSGDE